MWPFIQSGLEAAMKGHLVPGDSPVAPELIPRCQPEKMEALYITGHSLGAALAVLAAAMLHVSPRYACIREKLRGVYTFGQPLMGDQEFSDACDARFGELVFRHVYGHDIVTHLPPRLYGAFRTFGQGYVSTPDGWTHRTGTPTQTYTLVASAILGAFAWYAKQVPLLRSLRLPLSIADHSPANYVRCSRLSVPLHD